MLNEIEEFKAYTGKPTYTAAGKRDTTWLGRFTFDTLMDFEGIGRVLTIIARGYLFQGDGDPHDHIQQARNALCAWCSVPEKTKKPRKRGQSRRSISAICPTTFRSLWMKRATAGSIAM